MNAPAPTAGTRPSACPAALLDAAVAGLRGHRLIPYLGPEALLLEPANAALPVAPQALAEFLAKRVAVPARVRRNPTATAQYIENFRHRKTLTALMREAYAVSAAAPSLYRALAALDLPLVVDANYDDAYARLLAERAGAAPGIRPESRDWSQIQGVSRAEVRESWFLAYGPSGTRQDAASRGPLLYKPLGSIAPAANFIISDSDFVEVLTEIDIQTPIPPDVQERRAGRGFLFLGCRFADQLARNYARQVMKRSAGPHYAVLPADRLTRNEVRFIAEQGIAVIDRPLADAAATLVAALAPPD